MLKNVFLSLFFLSFPVKASILTTAKEMLSSATESCSGVINSAANWGTSGLHSRTFQNSPFKVPKSLAARYGQACLVHPSNTKSLLFSIFTDSGDGVIHDEALYCQNASSLIKSLKFAQIEAQIALDLVEDGKNGILALMKKLVRLNDIYITATMEKRFSECMDELAVKAEALPLTIKLR